MDQDVSKLIGRTVVSWDGKNYIIDNFGFDDWSAIQSWLVRDKRSRIIRAAYDAAESMPDHAAELKLNAMREAGNVTGITKEEFQQMLNGDEGVCRFLWVLFERRYPGKVPLESIRKMIESNAIDEAKILEILHAIMFAIGIHPDQGDSAEKKPDQAGG